ncbi:hypothetical protein [Ornithinicoccus hortensis]|uniref:TM2 domain-containing membrane protein YozV n=1 Tax=Ornithinicoccus hortensis TaxID=82346 RepID=A0A542YU22_9MICO|nr:hypothetical protein [Ornithinicoccus hortensis]TQL51582.1 hypothetical protein FB467_2732 [Ornithinicoccus hortensis]
MTEHEHTASRGAWEHTYESSPAPAYPLTPRPDGPPAPLGAADGPVRVEAKNPVISLVASFFVPGLGSFLNGDTERGIVIFAAYVASWIGYALLVWVLVGFLFLPVALGIWGYGMYHAYRGAEAWNARHGVLV